MQQRLLSISYITLASVALSIVLAMTMHFFQVRRGAAEIAKLRGEMVEIKQQMADRSDLQAVRKSLARLESDVKKVSDNLAKHP
jgi:uncharacterized protein YlxW (UPF0749 family)